MSHIGHYLMLLPALRGSKPFTVTSFRVTSANEFLKKVASLSNGLRRLRLQQGEVVAIAALNSDLYLEWLLAVMCAGAIVAPLNHRWSSEEACDAAEKVNAVMLVVDSYCVNWLPTFQSRLKTLRYQVSIEQKLEPNLIGSEDIRDVAMNDNELKLHWAPESTAIICFTSGTTGHPKGVALSHTSLLVQSLSKIAILGYNTSDVYLHTLPLCHIGGISSALAFVMAGGCQVFLPKFHTVSVVEAIAKYSVSAAIFVPTMLSDIVTYCKERHYDGQTEPVFTTMKKILNGGGSLSLELLKSVIEIFPETKIFSAYGMTETCSSLTFMIAYDPTLKNIFQRTNQEFSVESVHQGVYEHKHSGICVGEVAPHVQIKVNKDHDITLNGESHKIGKILTKGPHVMQKYWNQEDATAKAFTRDGWLDTSDVGWIDRDGKLWLLGRSKDMIKSGGENVYPSEVEEILMTHPGVRSVVVVGIPDSRFNEVVTASIQVEDDWQWVEETSTSTDNEGRVLSPANLQTHCRKHGLSRFKVPKRFFLHLGPFPATSTGKVKRDLVKEQIIGLLQRQHKARSRI